MRMRSFVKKIFCIINNFYWAARRISIFFYWTTSMAGCSFERLLRMQTIRSPLQRTSAFCRLFSTVRSYNQASQATGSKTVLCNASQLQGGVLRAHGHLTSLTKRSTMIHVNSLNGSVNVPCSYSVLWHFRRCIYLTSSE